MWVHYYFMSASAYTDSKHLKNNNKNKQVRHHDSDSTASACPGARSASINSPEWHPLTKNQMTEEFVAVLITRWIPCVSSSKQLGAEDTEPFTALWQYCNTWKPQPRSPAWQSGMSSCTNAQVFSGSARVTITLASLKQRTYVCSDKRYLTDESLIKKNCFGFAAVYKINKLSLMVIYHWLALNVINNNHHFEVSLSIFHCRLPHLYITDCDVRHPLSLKN